jgi:hypothetical protein
VAGRACNANTNNCHLIDILHLHAAEQGLVHSTNEARYCKETLFSRMYRSESDTGYPGNLHKVIALPFVYAGRKKIIAYGSFQEHHVLLVHFHNFHLT